MQYSRRCKLNQWSFCLAIMFPLCLLLLCYNCSATRSSQHVKQQPQENVPAIFAYGDSTMDTGNNNYLLTIIRCDFPPYGKDLKDHTATGRFCNGRITIDFFAEELGIKKNVPPYLDQSLKEEDLLTGVSFASSASGYDPLSSQMFNVKSLEDQRKMFKEYIEKVKKIVGNERTNFILNNSITIVATGACDIINSYYLGTSRKIEYDLEHYIDFLVSFSISHIKKLYKLGVRKIAVIGLPPIGCIPAQRTLGGGINRDCTRFLNEAAQLFNSKLEDELIYLKLKLPNSKLVYLDAYSVTLDLILNNTHYGFENVDRGCCGTGLIEGAMACNLFSPLCEADQKYLFWDSYHPTEKGYQILVQRFGKKYIGQFF